jgi:excisionase family DNA binding protein
VSSCGCESTVLRIPQVAFVPPAALTSPRLGFGLSKVKMKIATGEIRSIKDGKHRRILPEWIDDYIRAQVDRQDVA